MENANPVQVVVVNALLKNISLLNQNNKSKEVPVIHRVLLFTPSIRKHIDFQNMEMIIKQYMSDSSVLKSELLRIIAKYNEVSVQVDAVKVKSKDIVDYYLASIVVYQLLSINKYEDCYQIIHPLIKHFQTVGYMDKQKEYIVCRLYTYLMILHNHHYPLPTLLPDLLSSYRIGCLHNNWIVCSAIFNCILRVYIDDKQYVTAAHFLQRTEFPSNVSEKQYIRYCFYKALVSTVLLDYAEADYSLYVIHKKYPNQNGVFAEEVGKLFILVKLLIGDKPDLTKVPSTRPLRPYRDLAVVVMRGDLSAYKHVIEQKKQQFVDDGLMRIVSRLHNTVIRLALVKMAKSYSRISLAEIASILELDNVEEARCTCMRNIRDGIIQGRIEGDYFTAEDSNSVIMTSRPTDLFSKKIAVCLNLRNEIIKSSV